LYLKQQDYEDLEHAQCDNVCMANHYKAVTKFLMLSVVKYTIFIINNNNNNNNNNDK